jgi:glycosyltransferase involved in cell wall biosynthesis
VDEGRTSGRAPRVSVGLPVYNGEDYLHDAIESLSRQTFDDFEIVISDNASSDRTPEICRDFAAGDPRIRYHRNERNLGAAANYNAVFTRARGEYFKWASHDDLAAPDLLLRCVEILDREAGVVLAFSHFDYVDERGETLRRSAENLSIRGKQTSQRVRQLVDRQLEKTDIYWAIFGLIRASALQATRLIEAYVASDQTLLFHLILLGEFHQIPETLFFRREHADESMIKHSTPRERASWFDTTRKPSDFLFPNWRLLREHLALIREQRLPSGQALRCSGQVLRRFAHKWRALGGEIKAAGHGLLGSGRRGGA